MNPDTDFDAQTDEQLLNAYRRLDARNSPEVRARIKAILMARGFIATQDASGADIFQPSPELQAMRMSKLAFVGEVSFNEGKGLFRSLEPPLNDLGFLGKGVVRVENGTVRLTAKTRIRGWRGMFGRTRQATAQFNWNGIIDVERDENSVGFYYATTAGLLNVVMELRDDAEASHLTEVLPKGRSQDFKPRLHASLEYRRNFIARSPHTPATIGLVALNLLAFLATLLAGSQFLLPQGDVQVAWGSNFGPYTTDGDWWRLVSSQFIHFGIFHLLFNMWALASFGPIAERLYGSLKYLIIYLVSGTVGALASITLHPSVNSAGASAAIFGILGAMIAAQLRPGGLSPVGDVKALRRSTVTVTASALVLGFVMPGVDNAAHVGGLCSGFILGYAAYHSNFEVHPPLRWVLLRLSALIILSIAFILPGVRLAKAQSHRLTDDALYEQTRHWFVGHEARINATARTLVSPGHPFKLGDAAMADRFATEVLPFWRQADERFAAIHLNDTSPNRALLEQLQAFMSARRHAFELLVVGIRTSDEDKVSQAKAEQQRADDIIERLQPKANKRP